MDHIPEDSKIDVPGRVSGRYPEHFLLDTGSTITTVTPPIFSSLPGQSSTIPHMIANGDELDLEIKEAVVSFGVAPAMDWQGWVGKTAVALLGMDVLKMCNTAITKATGVRITEVTVEANPPNPLLALT